MPKSQLQHRVLLTPAELARHLGCSPRCGGYVVAQGVVASILVGGRYRGAPESDVERLQKDGISANEDVPKIRSLKQRGLATGRWRGPETVRVAARQQMQHLDIAAAQKTQGVIVFAFPPGKMPDWSGNDADILTARSVYFCECVLASVGEAKDLSVANARWRERLLGIQAKIDADLPLGVGRSSLRATRRLQSAWQCCATASQPCLCRAVAPQHTYVEERRRACRASAELTLEHA